MAGLRPGTSPPPVRMPMTPFLVLMLDIAPESPLHEMLNRKLSPLEEFLGRVKARFFFGMDELKYSVWKSEFDFCAEDGKEFGEPGVERGPGRAGDEVAVSDGISHGKIDIGAS